MLQQNKIKKAMGIISLELKNDPDYYIAWQANIAMAFKDEVNRLKPITNRWDRQDVHEIANQAAKNFLNLLIK